MACAECRTDGEGRCPVCGLTPPVSGGWSQSVGTVPVSGEQVRQWTAPPDVSWRSTRTPATVTVVLLGVCAAVDALSFSLGLRLRTLVGGLSYGEVAQSELDQLERAELLYGLVEVVQLAALVATSIAFLVWFYQTRINAEYFDAGRQRMSRGWTIGGWFVPVVSLWFPKKIANDIWDTSTPVGPDGTAPARLPGGVLNLWWGMFLLAMALDRLASEAYVDAETLGEIEGAITTCLFADGVGILAAVLAIRVVSRLTAMQHTLQEQRHRAPAADRS